MPGTRHTDGLSDSDARIVVAAEAELGRLLSVQPSPEFAAKVRARIAEPDAPRGWGWGAVGVSFAAAAALVVALTLRSGPAERDLGETPATPSRQDAALIVPPSDVHRTGALPLTSRGSFAGRSLKSAPPVEPRRLGEPEVLVDPALAEAIRRLAVSARNTVLDETVQHVTAPRTESLSLPTLVVEPLTVPELVLSPADPGGRQ